MDGDILSLVGGAVSLTQLLSLASSISVAKATITCVEPSSFPLLKQTASKELRFNPSTMRLTRNPDWSDGQPSGAGLRPMRYAGQPNDRLSFTLLLDESEYRGNTGQSILAALMPFGGVSNLLGFVVKNRANVLADVQWFYGLTGATVKATGSGSKATQYRPPLIQFLWGPFKFTGIVDEVEVEFLLFDQDGAPRRATVELALKGQAFVALSKAAGMLEVMSDTDRVKFLESQQLANALKMQSNELSSGETPGSTD